MRAEPIQALQDELCQFVLHTQARLAQLRQHLLEGRDGNWGQSLHPPINPLPATRTKSQLRHQGDAPPQDLDASWPTHQRSHSLSVPDGAAWQGENWCGETEASSIEAATRLESSSLDRLAAIKQRLAEQIKSL
jgi:hypothetical protein